MPAALSLDEYLDGLNTAALRLRQEFADQPEDSIVPTCPQWSARQLVAHTGMVHRWATGIVARDAAAGDPGYAEAFEEDGMLQDDPGAWLVSGAHDLSIALQAAPEDLQVFFFLKDAPQPRLAWARRQCHETTIHAFDALAARLGAVPSAEEAQIDPLIAADGIDELLAGFATRRSETLRTSRPMTVAVHAQDVDRGWTLRICDEPVVCSPGLPDTADSTWFGDAATLYLGLWNRGKAIGQEGWDLIGHWRDHLRVEWS